MVLSCRRDEVWVLAVVTSKACRVQRTQTYVLIGSLWNGFAPRQMARPPGTEWFIPLVPNFLTQRWSRRGWLICARHSVRRGPTRVAFEARWEARYTRRSSGVPHLSACTDVEGGLRNKEKRQCTC